MLVPVYAEYLAVREKAKETRSNHPVPTNVFLSTRGEPYRASRATHGGTGGNPLAQAHATACKAAGVSDFRPHDWRHDWAARMVIGGVDLLTVQKFGGWSDLRMVERYASFANDDHMQAAIMKIA
jgi:integrase